MNLAYWLRHPNLVIPRIRYWLWERKNADKPWLSPGAVAYCEQHLAQHMTGLEFGSGRSTLWFGQRLKHLTSIEHSAAWYERVKQSAAAQANVTLRFIPLDHEESEPERAVYSPLPAYVAVLDEFADESLHFVVVDGHYRTTLVKAAARKICPGGLLLVDDINLWGVQGPPVPNGWQLVSRSGNGIKETGVWRKPMR